MRSVRVQKGKEQLIAVKIFGFPAPQSTWLKNGSVLKSGPKLLISSTEKSSTLIIKNLVPDDTGIYSLKLTNAAGEASYDFKLRVLDRPGPPEPPITFSDVNRNSITICWNPPTDNGGSDITKYVIERCEVSSQLFVEVAQTVATAFRHVDQNVTENCEYVYRVCAVNGNGTSDPAESQPVVARASYGKPSAPQKPVTVRDVKDTSFTLGWCPPETDGGSPIIEYAIEKREASKKAWQPAGNTAPNCFSILISSLKKGTAYHFRITCRNEFGASPALTTDEAIIAGHVIRKYFRSFSQSEQRQYTSFRLLHPQYTCIDGYSVPGGVDKAFLQIFSGPPTPPEAPLEVSNVTNKTCTLSWRPPKDNGGAELTAYVIWKKEHSSTSWTRVMTIDANRTTCLVQHLNDKFTYMFRVCAENISGSSDYLESAEAVKLKAAADRPTPPTAPLEYCVTGPTSMDIEWGRPESDGGSPLTGYIVAIKDIRRRMWMEVAQVDAETHRLHVKELQESREYLVRVFARNEIGLSDPLEMDESVKITRPEGFTGDEQQGDDKTPSASFTTETSSSWIRDHNVEPLLRSYTKHKLKQRHEYFFKLSHYSDELFKE